MNKAFENDINGSSFSWAKVETPKKSYRQRQGNLSMDVNSRNGAKFPDYQRDDSIQLSVASLVNRNDGKAVPRMVDIRSPYSVEKVEISPKKIPTLNMNMVSSELSQTPYGLSDNKASGWFLSELSFQKQVDNIQQRTYRKYNNAPKSIIIPLKQKAEFISVTDSKLLHFSNRRIPNQSSGGRRHSKINGNKSLQISNSLLPGLSANCSSQVSLKGLTTIDH